MIHFIVGTEAELIKIFPVMIRLKKRGIDYNFISTGQHKISSSEILSIFKLKKPDYILYKGPLFTSIFKITIWFFKTILINRVELSKIFKNDKKGIVLVHGDTVSTLLGTVLARAYGLKVAHLESGLRSFNILDPFPEELIRKLVTQFSTTLFCPNSWALGNVSKYKNKQKINLKQNTLLDSFIYIMNYIQKNPQRIKEMKLPKKYFVFILHRTETLYFILNKNLVGQLINFLIKWSGKMKSIFVLHHTTEKKLGQYDLVLDIKKNKNIILLPRQSYLEFMHILSKAEFIVTDGGSNQEECFYTGLPTLLIRKNTERIEGLRENVILSKLNFEIINDFFKNYKIYKRPPLTYRSSPSDEVIDYLIKFTAD